MGNHVAVPRSFGLMPYLRIIPLQIKWWLRPLIGALMLICAVNAHAGAAFSAGLSVENAMDSNGIISVINGSKVKVAYTVDDPEKLSHKKDRIELLRVSDGRVLSSVARGKKKNGSVWLLVKKSVNEQLYVRYVRKGKEAEEIARDSHPNDEGSIPLMSIAKVNIAVLTVGQNALLAALYKVYEIGDDGPGGGVVFYVTDGGLHGLEAAPENLGEFPWGCIGIEIVGSNSTAIGAGAQNTGNILASCMEPKIAARIVGNAWINGHNDWYLPSRSEAYAMFENLYPEGGEEYRSVTSNNGGCPDNSCFSFVWWKAASGAYVDSNAGRAGSIPLYAIRSF